MFKKKNEIGVLRMLEPTSGLVKFEKTDSTGWLILVRLWVSWIGVWLVNSLTVLVLPCVSFSTFLSCKTKSVNVHLRKFEIWLNKQFGCASFCFNMLLPSLLYVNKSTAIGAPEIAPSPRDRSLIGSTSRVGCRRPAFFGRFRSGGWTVVSQIFGLTNFPFKKRSRRLKVTFKKTKERYHYRIPQP